VLFGLGTSAAVSRLTVKWPDGRSEDWSGVPVDAWTTLRQGEGK